MWRRALRGSGRIGAAKAGVGVCFRSARRLNRCGATSEEFSRALPGDDEVAFPFSATTRAITIHAPAEAVWPWLVQMGWRRAGWYSFDAIDNDHVRSSDHIVPALQVDLHVGDFVPEGVDVGWKVAAVETGRMLLLTSHGPMKGVEWLERRDSSWLFVIEEVGGESSRLLERSRTAMKTNRNTRAGRVAARFAPVAIACGDFVMAQRHMRGLKRRAEADWASKARAHQAAA